MSYCTPAEAKSAGARGTVAEITAAITAAMERIDRYTGEPYEPTALTIEADVDPNGYAYCHRRIIAVTSVTWAGASTPIDVSGYRISSSSMPGGHDRVELVGALGWSDVTVLGAEPWNGGWPGFASRYGDPRVLIVGSFGWTTVPGQVRDACAALAAYLRGTDADTEDPAVTTDIEGNVMPVVESPKRPAKSDSIRDRTTGSVVADELLADFVRRPVKIGG